MLRRLSNNGGGTDVSIVVVLGVHHCESKYICTYSFIFITLSVYVRYFSTPQAERLSKGQAPFVSSYLSTLDRRSQ
jgi:hypothetical protein